ncbi:unnamed protein product [Ectocarpus sp. 6 AP-2014]
MSSFVTAGAGGGAGTCPRNASQSVHSSSPKELTNTGGSVHREQTRRVLLLLMPQTWLGLAWLGWLGLAWLGLAWLGVVSFEGALGEAGCGAITMRRN